MRQSAFDLVLLYAIGLLGVVMRRFDFPTAPVVVGMILGPLAEAQMRNAMSIGEGKWSVFLERPVSLALLVVVVAVLVLPRVPECCAAPRGRRLELAAVAPARAARARVGLAGVGRRVGRGGRPALQVADRQLGQRRDPLVLVVQAGDVVELSPPACRKAARASWSISSSVSRQSAGEAGADHVDALDAGARQRDAASARCRAPATRPCRSGSGR